MTLEGTQHPPDHLVAAKQPGGIGPAESVCGSLPAGRRGPGKRGIVAGSLCPLVARSANLGAGSENGFGPGLVSRFLAATLITLSFALLGGGLAGCGRLEPTEGSPGGPAATATAAGSNAVTVQRGDTVSAIAVRHSVPMRDLIEVNHLVPPFRVEPGQRLVLPNTRAYTVGSGQSLSGIAQSTGIDQHEIIRLNDLQPPYALRSGQKLRLPGGSGGGMSVAATTANDQASPPIASLGHKPTPGAIEATSLAPYSHPTAAASAGAPSPLAIAPPVPLTRPTAPPPEPAHAAAARPPLAAPQTASPAVAPPVPPAPTAVTETPAPRAGSRFLWPVKGKIISGYGPKPDGLTNDGVNIASPPGSAVTAADHGVVVYAGNELHGYGNLLLVRHSDGFITAYAHLDQMAVERGDRVVRGHKIGTVGGTGSVSSPQLHFEVRKGSQPVNPMEHMDQAKPAESRS
ncbi:lipoprotein NlpD [uncultured Gammaproteobacteria bacterium]